jgi:hypothetical protein
MNNSEYKVPENYFLEKKAILKRIPARQKNIFQLHPWRSALGIAASISLIIALGLNYSKATLKTPINLNQVSAIAIDEFISYSHYSAYPEAYLLEEESIDIEISNSGELFNEDQIDDYLNEYTNEFL